MKKKDNLPPQPYTVTEADCLGDLAVGGCGSCGGAAPRLQTAAVPFDAEKSFEALLEHWVKARIDGPMQTVARYDEAAKQLVTTGGLMQGVLVAAFTLMDKQGGAAFQVRGWWWVSVILFMASLVAFFICAMKVCWPQPDMNASGVYVALKEAMKENATTEKLDCLMRRWCGRIDHIYHQKRNWLLAQAICFTFCSVLMVGLILFPLMGG